MLSFVSDDGERYRVVGGGSNKLIVIVVGDDDFVLRGFFNISSSFFLCTEFMSYGIFMRMV